MIGKLIKHDFGYNLLDANSKHIATSKDEYSNGVKQDYWLSLKNCKAIENGYDLDELVKSKYPNVDNEDFEYDCEHDMIRDNYRSRGFYEGAKAIIEILGDKRFNEHDIKKVLYLKNGFDENGMSFYYSDKEIIQSLQQTEWQVEILTEPMNLDEIKEQGKGFLNVDLRKFKLDSDKCLILKRA
jgi:hypothetical protein